MDVGNPRGPEHPPASPLVMSAAEANVGFPARGDKDAIQRKLQKLSTQHTAPQIQETS